MKLHSLLNHIERIGNKLPSPTLLFIYLCGVILVLSAVAAVFGVSAIHPLTGESIAATNLLSEQGLHLILTKTVNNFIAFAPVGSVIVAVMGIGIAEHSGLIDTLLKVTVQKAPERFLSFSIVLAGVLSSLAMDTGYVVLIPIAALVFKAAGRSPIVGIAAAFAGVSAGFSANLLIGPFDAILAGLSTEAAALVAPNYEVTAAGNYYFMMASTLLIAVVGAFVTDAIVSKRFAHAGEDGTMHLPSAKGGASLSPAEKKGLKATLGFTLGFIGLVLLGLVPDEGILRSADNGSILNSPFLRGIVFVIAFYAAIAGYIFGKISGKFQDANSVSAGMEKHVSTLASYLVLMFFAAQFVSYFNWSQLGSIIAISGANVLRELELGTGVLLGAFILMAAFINLFIGSASGKWALIAPIFVPMLLLSGISPEATQVAYRIGDSSTNIITPLMPYFGVVVAFAQQHDAKIGIGTIISMMLPYSIALLLIWSALLLVWIGLDLPLGPDAAILIDPQLIPKGGANLSR